MLMNELVCNIELGHPKSVYCFRKNRDALLEWGPAWDYDWGYGYQGGNYVYFQNPDRMMFDLSRRPVKMDIQPGAGADFFSQFFLMPEFEEIYKQEWERLLPKIRDIDSYVLEQGQQLELSWQEDQKRWSNPPITHKYDYLDMMQYLVKRIDMITEVVGTE